MSLTIEQIDQVKKGYEAWENAGNKITYYTCPSCKDEIPVKQPNDGRIWDSARECLGCGNISFVVVRPNGKTKVLDI